MNTEMLVEAMTSEIYEKLREAVELGKWLDGSPLNAEQRETSLQAVMLYQAKVLKSDQHMTVGENGEIVQKSRQELQKEMSQDPIKNQTIARFKQDDI